MAVVAGTRLGPYEILSPIGAGGMGEVYKARDTRLDRIVALKVSKTEFSERFEREARAIAALNHSNICTLHDVGPNYLVMELVEGLTLAERIQQGPLPLEEALLFACQIADALEAAHEKGIIHRDLKPSNIKITPEGRVKVLDFGLAAILQAPAFASPAADPVSSPTLTISPTRAGMILGTAAYMSPEQARGTAVDQRSDIWAFGLVLYEMLAGRPAFAGDTVTDILASVMKEQPDLDIVPQQVRPALTRCLSKDRRARWGSIGDVRWALDAVPPDRSPSVAKGTRRLPWMVAAAFAAAALAAIWGWLHTPPAPPSNVTRLAMTMAGLYNAPALSRDGTRLAYSEASSPPRLWLRMMDQLEGHRIPGSDAGIDPAFSPDGQWIAYIHGPPPLQLKKVPVTGGTSITLCDLPVPPPNLYWGEDDSILFGSSKGLMRVPAAGGRPENLTIPDTKNGESDHNFAELLPGGHAILFTIAMGYLPDASRIAVLDLKTHASRVVVNSGFAARYVLTGHLVYRRGAALFAVPFDLKRLAVTGSETPVVEGLANGLPGATQYALSSSGLLVYQARSGSEVMGARMITWMDRKGTPQPLSEPPHGWGVLRLSPDGKTVAGDIATNAGAANRRIWLYHTDRAILTPLTSGGDDWSPVWTPDGRWVAFGSNRGGKFGIYRVPADSSGPPELLLATESAGHPSPASPCSWTPDGKTLLYDQADQGQTQIWLLPLAGSGGDGKPRRFHPEATHWEARPQVSPDGKWLAYSTSPSGISEVYVTPFQGPGGKFPVSTQGGDLSVWSHNGRELLYVELNPRRLMSVEIQAGSAFQAGRPQPLFTIRNDSGPVSFDVAPDGKRFLVRRQPEDAINNPVPSITSLAPSTAVTGSAPQTTFIVVTDWFADLLRRAPVKR